jgi:hypothetical protein
MNRILPTLLLTTTIAAGAAVPAVAAEKTGVREVCAKSVYVTLKPGAVFSGTLKKGEKIEVTRYSPSGKFAFGKARGHVNREGWVKAASLCK